MFGFIRAGGFLAMLPIFSAANVPVKLRVLFAAMLGMLVAPAMDVAPAAPGLFGSMTQLTSEALIGTALGFVARIVIGGIEIAGQLISAELGLNMSSILNPISTTPTQAPGMALLLLATTLLFALDLHHWLIAGFVKSYAVLPVGGAHLQEGLLVHILKLTGQMFVIAVQMAAPIMAVSFVVLLVFAMLGRAVPQMNVFSESFAFRIMAGLFVFAATLPLMGQHIANALRRIPDDMMRVAQWLS
jgi:flagellar biosynthesis protein FliR